MSQPCRQVAVLDMQDGMGIDDLEGLAEVRLLEPPL